MKTPFQLLSASSLVTFILLLTGCKAFMHGYTWDKSVNSYHQVTGNKNNFGDKRIVYVKGFHRRSTLTHFLNGKDHNRGTPDFIYEYEVEKRRGIKLYYTKLDSVFVFEEPKKNCICTVLKETRTITDEEKKALLPRQ